MNTLRLIVLVQIEGHKVPSSVVNELVKFEMKGLRYHETYPLNQVPLNLVAELCVIMVLLVHSVICISMKLILTYLIQKFPLL